MVTANPMKASASGSASSRRGSAASVGASVLARFSTAATQMTGEGLAEYAIFMDPRSMTKIPTGKGCLGK